MGVYDIGGQIEQWALKSYAVSKNRSSVLDQDIRFEINWDGVKFRAEDRVWNMKTTPKNSVQTLFCGAFSNPTSTSTGHSIKLDKETDALVIIEIKDGQTHGLQPSLSLELPGEITQATPVFGHNIKLDTNLCLCERTEKIRWAVDHQIPNPQKTGVRAHVGVKERTCEGTFACTATLEGHVVVQLFGRNDNRHLGVVENDIVEIFRPLVSNGRNGKNSSKDKQLTIVGKTVKWQLHGTCKFVFGIEHQLKLRQTENADDDTDW